MAAQHEKQDPRLEPEPRPSAVRLIAIDDELARIVEHSGDGFAAAYGASLGEKAATVRAVVVQTRALLERTPRASEWGCFLAVDRRQSVVVGTCGFVHGPEADGSVEIAYFTFPGFEGRGYATAMARELFERAAHSPAVRQVVAHTLPERNASTRVLEKVGLRLVGDVEDPDEGRVWRWAWGREGA